MKLIFGLTLKMWIIFFKNSHRDVAVGWATEELCVDF